MNSTNHSPLYQQAVQDYGADIARFTAGYERDPARRRELLQEVHLALWQSLAQYKTDCSLRTWVYRVAHNVGVSHIQRSLRNAERNCLTLEEIEHMSSDTAEIAQTERRLDLQKVLALIHRLAPLDRQVMLLYLEDMDAAGIADITGLSARNVATKVHRIKTVLANQLGMERKTA
ncbi:RNA polymerase sigma factor [Duganella qianjiadongensis]|uniref:Sigma-70 family RNA polymerase sigma factor n=1 Tax=Duganella qianjiadongensis TaxID=2692176 RepID=A0ABW9VK18_9BURK|nr:sigma-70 family RNA polymerase sigma factor [Duganella qianjiadongensis]MYM39944.1 sigma-70 family RNA polymerase sigma factor [Duganella qianjiadongensis]